MNEVSKKSVNGGSQVSGGFIATKTITFNTQSNEKQ